MKRIPNLTSLRFLLALLVVIFHIPLFFSNRELPFYNDLPIFNKGTEAVYMFFSLSGFLIIKQLFEEKKLTGTINLKSFYMRRVLRIFPLYYLVLIIGLFYYQIILPKLGFQFESNYDLWKGILLSVTFFPNIFATFQPGGILEILWSIGIEEQFYIIIAPLLLLIPAKKTRTFLILFTIIYFIIYLLPSLPFLQKFKMLFFYFSFSGFCSIMLDNEKFRKFLIIIKIPILIILIVYFTTSIFVNNFNDFFYHLIGTILLGLSISILSLSKINFLENKTLEYLGKISYGLYMYHSIVMQLVGFIFLKYIPLLKLPNCVFILLSNLMVINITILLSHLSYKYFESFFLNLKKNFRK